MYRWDGSFDFKRREDWDYKSETHGLLVGSASWRNAWCFDMANIGNVGIAGSPISLVKHQCFARPELHSVHVGPSMSIRQRLGHAEAFLQFHGGMAWTRRNQRSAETEKKVQALEKWKCWAPDKPIGRAIKKNTGKLDISWIVFLNFDLWYLLLIWCYLEVAVMWDSMSWFEWSELQTSFES